jgi:hypothetical protein
VQFGFINHDLVLIAIHILRESERRAESVHLRPANILHIELHVKKVLSNTIYTVDDHASHNLANEVIKGVQCAIEGGQVAI